MAAASRSGRVLWRDGEVGVGPCTVRFHLRPKLPHELWAVAE